jgi:hypothetical protein
VSFVYLSAKYQCRQVPQVPELYADSLGIIWRVSDAGVWEPAKYSPPTRKSPYPRVVHWRVHTLVLWAFSGVRPRSASGCRHLNDLKTDNRPDNLAWGTSAENADDRRKNSRGKGLTVDDLPAAVITLLRGGHSYSAISELLQLPLRTVHHWRVRYAPDYRNPLGKPKKHCENCGAPRTTAGWRGCFRCQGTDQRMLFDHEAAAGLLRGLGYKVAGGPRQSAPVVFAQMWDPEEDAQQVWGRSRDLE